MSRIVKEADVRKQELLDIGTRMYLEDNIVNVKKIVKEANVAVGLFYYYFESKEKYIGEITNKIISDNLKNIKAILVSNEYLAKEKLNILLELIWNHLIETNKYVDNSTFKTNEHYILTEKMLLELKPYVEEFIKQGIKERAFHVTNISLISSFILYGIVGIINTKLDLNDNTKKLINGMIYKSLNMED